MKERKGRIKQKTRTSTGKWLKYFRWKSKKINNSFINVGYILLGWAIVMVTLMFINFSKTSMVETESKKPKTLYDYFKDDFTKDGFALLESGHVRFVWDGKHWVLDDVISNKHQKELGRLK